MHIVHLFPKTLGLFGDVGNVVALRKRCEWRGIDARVSEVELGQDIPSSADVYVIGSGSSNSVKLVGAGISEVRDALSAALSRDASVLAIGAGLHLLSDRIEWSDGSTLTAAGLIEGQSVPRAQRLVGEFVGDALGHSVAGFMNTGHRLETDLPPHIRGIVFENSQDVNETDGIEFGTVIGTHSHGSYLPMNPAIADAIISRSTGQSFTTESERIDRADRAALASRLAIRQRLGL